ncbi:MAG: hypothetical protein ACAH88_10540, partial [Roseimicrobium sp.]
HGIAKWNGSKWSALGLGLEGAVHCITFMGGAVHAGVENAVARWDGSQWQFVGVANELVSDMLAVGATLVVAGNFTQMNGVDANHVARLSGSTWSPLGPGMDAPVNTLAYFGGSIYAGGSFAQAGGNPAPGVARWNGTAWLPVGDYFSYGEVRDLLPVGSSLYAGGVFDAGLEGAYNVARLDGNRWVRLGGGVTGPVNTLAFFGGYLYAGGEFESVEYATPAYNIARWNGTSWAEVGGGADYGGRGIPYAAHGAVHALAVTGTTLHVGGTFSFVSVNCPALHYGRWNGSLWSGTNTGLFNADPYTPTSVTSMVMLGNSLYVAGDFVWADNLRVNSVARWTGGGWAAVGSGLRGWVSDLEVMGNILYASGGFLTVEGDPSLHPLFKWDGTKWSGVGPPFVMASAGCLQRLGNELFAAGYFQESYDKAAVTCMKWNGLSWTEAGFLNGEVADLAVMGGELYAGGQFTGGVAKWSGRSWSIVGGGVSGRVSVLAASATDLYVGGAFDYVYGTGSGAGIARWDGHRWASMGEPMFNEVLALEVVDGLVYAGGTTLSGFFGSRETRLARWDGAAWIDINLVDENFRTPDGDIHALKVWGSDLYVGGTFKEVMGIKSAAMVRARVGPIPHLPPGINLGRVVVTATGATIEGKVNPYGSATTVRLEYSMNGLDVGETPSPLDATPSSFTGTVVKNVSATITGMQPGEFCWCRLTATNAMGVSYSSEETFVVPTSTVAFDLPPGSTIVVREEEDLRLPLIRTNSSGEPVTVYATTTNGTATAPTDFVSLANAPITVLASYDQWTFPVELLDPPNTPEANETFTVKLSGPFVTPGGTTSVTVRILDSADTIPPTVAIANPASGGQITWSESAMIKFDGTITDNQGVALVELAVDEAAVGDSNEGSVVLADRGAPKTAFAF